MPDQIENQNPPVVEPPVAEPPAATAVTPDDIKALNAKLDQFITLNNQHGNKLNTLASTIEELRKGGGRAEPVQIAGRPRFWVKDPETNQDVPNLEYDAQMEAYETQRDHKLTQIERGVQTSTAGQIADKNEVVLDGFRRNHPMSEAEFNKFVVYAQAEGYAENLSRDPSRPFYRFDKRSLEEAYDSQNLASGRELFSKPQINPQEAEAHLKRLYKRDDLGFTLTPTAPRPSAAQQTQLNDLATRTQDAGTLNNMSEQELNLAVDKKFILPSTRDKLLRERARDSRHK